MEKELPGRSVAVRVVSKFVYFAFASMPLISAFIVLGQPYFDTGKTKAGDGQKMPRQRKARRKSAKYRK